MPHKICTQNFALHKILRLKISQRNSAPRIILYRAEFCGVSRKDTLKFRNKIRIKIYPAKACGEALR
ncbi:MAG: hypothetical protein D8H92_11880 [Campylobacter sp.]|nr:MAG: hypothetical protein D8H92_11880 [Campylobacter sp.]